MADDDDTVTVARGMAGWRRDAQRMNAAVLTERERHNLRPRTVADTSPDPEGAEAAVLAPDSDTAGEAEQR